MIVIEFRIVARVVGSPRRMFLPRSSLLYSLLSSFLGENLRCLNFHRCPIVLFLHVSELRELPQEVAFKIKLSHDVVISRGLLDIDLLALNQTLGFLVGVSRMILLCLERRFIASR